MAYLGSDPTTVFAPPGSVSLTSLDAPTQALVTGALQSSKNLSDIGNKATAATNLGVVQKVGDTMTGNLVLQSSAGNYSPYFYLMAPGYAPFIRANNAGNKTIDFVNAANSAVNMSLDDVGNMNVRATIACNNGLVVSGSGGVFNNGVTLKGLNTICYSDTGAQCSVFYGNSAGNTVGFTNAANTAWNLNWTDAGAVNVRNALTVGAAASFASTVTAASTIRSTAGGGQFQGSVGPGIGSGTTINWNESGGNGETDIVNCAGGGGGGFTFRSVNSNNTVQNFAVTISGNGSVNGVNTLTTAGNIQCNGSQINVQSAVMGTDGNIYGGVWGSDWLSNFLPRTCWTRMDSHTYKVAWDGGAANLNLYVDGTFQCYIHANASDAALKSNIVPITPDSLSLVNQIVFSSYDMGEYHSDMGVMAQQLQTITPRWVYRAPAATPEPTEENPEPIAIPGPLSYDVNAMLFDALRSIQQLTARVATLEAALAAKGA